MYCNTLIQHNIVQSLNCKLIWGITLNLLNLSSAKLAHYTTILCMSAHMINLILKADDEDMVES